MAATRPFHHQQRTSLSAISFLILISTLTLSIFFIGCAVDMSPTTVGADSDCMPSADQISSFQFVMSGYFQSTGTLGTGGPGCGNCHLTNANNNASASFPILPGSETSSVVQNFCTAQKHASTLQTEFLLGSGHLGPAYTGPQVQTLREWARSITTSP